MQVPQRRSQKLRLEEPTSYHVTSEGFTRLKQQLADIERDLPQAREDVARTARFGDFSENAEYQDAKFRLRRLNDRAASLKHRISRAIIIESDHSGSIQLGVTVVARVNGAERTLQIVGPQEANPMRGRISHVSPIGSALIGHVVGDDVFIETPGGSVTYTILSVE